MPARIRKLIDERAFRGEREEVAEKRERANPSRYFSVRFVLHKGTDSVRIGSTGLYGETWEEVIREAIGRDLEPEEWIVFTATCAGEPYHKIIGPSTP